MSLKSSIVIRNQFTMKTQSGRGTRGTTPGKYVLRYMARDLATETVTPAKLLDVDSYITKYMARESAVESMDTIPRVKDAMYDGQKLGGVAFGYGDVSLSDEKLRLASKDIQRCFDNGHTVMKTVLSFDKEFLESHGLLDENFEYHNRGDFRSHIDQLKLRMAIMAGLDKLSRRYDDLQYVGVIQVDTANIHCHLAMVDRGAGKRRKNGFQNGSIGERGKDLLRRSIDQYLDRKQSVRMLSSSVTMDRRNVLCYVKKFAHKTMYRQGVPQFLIACLPQDRTMWRAGTSRKEMRKANAIMREYVVNILNQKGSGYSEAIADIQRYADYRSQREGLNDIARAKLIRDGQERIIEDSMNAVYGILRRIPRSELNVRTAMLASMSMDYEEMASQTVDDPMMEFGFKLRTYSSRINHHRDEYHKYRDERRVYEATEDKHPDSEALGEYLRVEAMYNAMLMVKYQYFLSFLPSDEDLEDELEELLDEKERLENLKKMRDDPAFARMSEDSAEDYGLRVYGQRGGRRVLNQRGVIQARIDAFENRVRLRERDFKDKLHDRGFDYDGSSIVKDKMYAFDEVKALDLHHLGYDFPYDIRISKVNIDRFTRMANLRYRAFMGAKDYLVRSGQELALSSLPEKDVVFMKQYADSLSGSVSLKTTRPLEVIERSRRSSTVRLGHDYLPDVNNIVRSVVNDTYSAIERDERFGG